MPKDPDLSSDDYYMLLLDRALSSLSKIGAQKKERLPEISPQVLKEAGFTMVTNFGHIASSLNREPQHVAKFILKETGKPGNVRGERLVIQGSVVADDIKRLLELYVKEFIKCPVCGGPDTKLVAEKRFRFLVCEVCGAKSSVRRI